MHGYDRDGTLENELSCDLFSVGHWFRPASFSHEFCLLVLLCNLLGVFLPVGYSHLHVDGEGQNFPQSKKNGWIRSFKKNVR